jgi:carbonic anhydrase
MSQNRVLAQLQAANDEWRKAVLQVAPDFFERGAQGQAPKVLWIGCADSRVPESVVLAAKPGDVFVHRNIAKCAAGRFRFPSSYIPLPLHT